MTAKIVEIPVPNLKEVPAALRMLAGQIEDGEIESAIQAIVIIETQEGRINVFGYGEVGNRANAIGILQMASMQMATQDC